MPWLVRSERDTVGMFGYIMLWLDPGVQPIFRSKILREYKFLHDNYLEKRKGSGDRAYWDAAIGWDSSSGDNNDSLRRCQDIGDILLLAIVSCFHLSNWHADSANDANGANEVLACSCTYPWEE